jgi:sec-independent protein translocase protein TatA
VDQHPLFVLGIGLPHGFEWIFIALIMLLLFGRRLPEVMRGLGGSVKEFKKGMEEGHKIDPLAPGAPPASPPASPPVEGAVPRPPAAIPPPAAAPPTTPGMAADDADSARRRAQDR